MGRIEEDAAFVILSPHRTQVLIRLSKGSAIPAQIREDTGLEYSRITESINSLRDQDLVELLVPDETKRGRMYGITGRGEAVLEYMDEQNMIDQER